MNKELKPIQLKAITYLAAGHTVSETAHHCKVSRETVSRWKQDSRFQARVNALQMEYLREARVGLTSLASKAVKRLEELIDNAQSEQTRLRACLAALHLSGVNDPEHFGWGIGPDSAKEIECDAAQKKLLDTFLSK